MKLCSDSDTLKNQEKTTHDNIDKPQAHGNNQENEHDEFKIFEERCKVRTSAINKLLSVNINSDNKK